MRKVIILGKIDYNQTGRKINLVTLEIELKFENSNKKTIDLVKVNEPYEVFTMSGNVWNNRKTDIICDGQCCDDFIEFFPNNKPLKRLIEIWNEWHLNDLNAGTRKQKEALKNNKGDDLWHNFQI
jgi:hypothetical protein